MRLYFNLNKITYLFLMQALYLCIACEEPFDVGMPIPEDAIVFDGVITDEPPPYYFVLSKPSTKLKYKRYITECQIDWLSGFSIL